MVGWNGQLKKKEIFTNIDNLTQPTQGYNWGKNSIAEIKTQGLLYLELFR